MKDIAAITHARGDDRYLGVWLDFYGPKIGRENLYVLLIGDDWTPEVDLTGVNVEIVTGQPRQRTQLDKFFVEHIRARAEALLSQYHTLIRTDSDEIVVVDPKFGDFRENMLGTKGIVNCLGIDMLHNRKRETAPLDVTRPILSQRIHGKLSTAYSKPAIVSDYAGRPVPWQNGFHRVRGVRGLDFDPRFYMIHLAMVDYDWALWRLDRRRALSPGAELIQVSQDKIEAIVASDDFPVDGDVLFSYARKLFDMHVGKHAQHDRPWWEAHNPENFEKGGMKNWLTLPERFRTLF